MDNGKLVLYDKGLPEFGNSISNIGTQRNERIRVHLPEGNREKGEINRFPFPKISNSNML